MTDVEKSKRNAPYVSAAALSKFFDHIRYVATPKKVDFGLLSDYGISKGNVFALMSALKFLGLVDKQGTPTAAFASLQVMGEEFVKNLNEVVRNAYADLFSRLDVSKDSREHIRNYFSRNYSPSQSEKATVLFLDLCKEANIAVAPKTVAQNAEAPKKDTIKPPGLRIIRIPDDRGKAEQGGESKQEITLSDDELRRAYLKKLIDRIATPDTTGKDAAAIEAEAKLRNAELDRIERLIGISNKKEG